MATSGTVKTNTTYDSYFWVSWSQKGNQDIANNETTINWSVGVYCGHSFYSNAIRMSAVSINGTQVYGGGTYSNYSSGDHTIDSGTLVIKHGTDGSKTFSIGAFTGWLYSSYNYSAAATNHTLTTIPRISKPTVSASSVNFGGKITVYTNRASSTFTHHLYYSINGEAEVGITPGIETSYEWPVPKSLMNKIPSATRATITFRLYTFAPSSSTTPIGSDTVSFEATVPTSGAEYYPTISNIVWTKSSGEPSGWPITQNVSSGSMAMTGVSGAYSSTITSASLTFAGLSASAQSLTVGKISSSGNLKAVARVTDSRGRSFTKEVTFTVAAYSKPELSVTIYRCDSSGNEDDYGDYMYVKASATISSVGNNAITGLGIQYKQKSQSTYTSVTLTNDTPKIIAASSNNTWNWIVSVVDRIFRVETTGSLSTGAVVLDILANGKGLGIGKVAEKEGLDSAWDFMKDGAVVDYVVEQGVSGVWYYKKMYSGWVEMWAWVNPYHRNGSVLGIDVNYPFTLKSSFAGLATLNSAGGNAGSALPWNVKLEIGSSACSVWVHNNGSTGFSSTTTLPVSVHILGKWK